MFTVRPYREEDAMDCGVCFYEGFFSCPVNQDDKLFLCDFAQILVEKCNFTYVAESEDHQVVGFICGKYDKNFSKTLAGQHEIKRHYGRWCQKFIKFYLKRYKMSAEFRKEFNEFVNQAKERDKKTFGKCDLELAALSSRKDYRQGLGTALLTQFLSRAKRDGVSCVRLFTNTIVSWEFYEKQGFQKVAEKSFPDNSGHRSFVYEYILKE